MAAAHLAAVGSYFPTAATPHDDLSEDIEDRGLVRVGAGADRVMTLVKKPSTPRSAERTPGVKRLADSVVKIRRDRLATALSVVVTTSEVRTPTWTNRRQKTSTPSKLPSCPRSSRMLSSALVRPGNAVKMKTAAGRMTHSSAGTTPARHGAHVDLAWSEGRLGRLASARHLWRSIDLLWCSLTKRLHAAASMPKAPAQEMMVRGEARDMVQVLSSPATKLPEHRTAIPKDWRAAAFSGSLWAISTSAPSAPVSAIVKKSVVRIPIMHIS
eukprot:1192441-Prorocentrum_minimum.AAC.4